MKSTKRNVYILSFVCILGYFSLPVSCDQLHNNLRTNARTGRQLASTASKEITTDIKPPEIPKFDTLHSELLVPEDERICFVHIGKTAGSTIGCLLGFDYQCKGSNHIPDGLLPRRVTRLLHGNINDCAGNKFGYYLISTRNPLKRMESWFTYERPGARYSTFESLKKKAELYFDCPFETFNDLGEIGLTGNPNNKTVCQTRAEMAVKGKIGYVRHNSMNYNWTYHQLDDRENSKIIVIRTEHIEKDWLGIEERVLGGDLSKVHLKVPQRNSSPKHQKDEELSDLARRNICRLLCDEIQMYKWMLQQAENLDKQDFNESMEELQKSCPVEVQSETCEGYSNS